MNTSKQKSKPKSKYSLLATIFILVGLLIIAMYFKTSITHNNKCKDFIDVDSEVISHEYKDGKLVGVVLEYTVGEDTYKTVANLHEDNIKSYGTIVMLKYNPEQPDEVIVANQKVSLWLPIAGLSSLVIGVSIFIVILLYNIKIPEKHYIPISEAPVYDPNKEQKKIEKKKKKEKIEENVNELIEEVSKDITVSNNEKVNEEIAENTNNPIVTIPFQEQKIETNIEEIKEPEDENRIVDTSFIIEDNKKEEIKPEIEESKEEIKENENDPNDQKLKELIGTLDNSDIPSFIPKKK